MPRKDVLLRRTNIKKKKICRPSFSMPSTQTLVEIYNKRQYYDVLRNEVDNLENLTAKNPFVVVFPVKLQREGGYISIKKILFLNQNILKIGTRAPQVNISIQTRSEIVCSV